MRPVAILSAPVLDIMFVGKDSNAQKGDEYIKIIKNEKPLQSLVIPVHIMIICKSEQSEISSDHKLAFLQIHLSAKKNLDYIW